jgi:hypothetical protein
VWEEKWCGESWMSTCRRVRLDPYLSLLKVSSGWIKDVRVIPKTRKLVEEKGKL